MNSDPSDNDINFTDAMQDVTPHQHDRADVTVSKRIDAKNRSYRRTAAVRTDELIVDGLSDTAVDQVGPEQPLLFALPGVQQRLLQRLRQGHIPWDQGLDLHGYTVDQARNQLSLFIRDARQHKQRCLLLVHGKAHSNEALLKSYINEWLRRIPGVLAFCSAQPADGGNGAVYILLKR
ncbi:Smr/MutS family protein [Pontibacter sp. JAM-7]|uniref:Smr/MutS family protein n=1 Tax=Pontibacter sp. JAM-7 TaxID=3366581 RepID=UPI003AF9C9DE